MANPSVPDFTTAKAVSAREQDDGSIRINFADGRWIGINDASQGWGPSSDPHWGYEGE